jgi:hypothetical protein
MRLADQKWLTDLLLAAAVYAVSAVPVLTGLTMASTPGILVHEEAMPAFLHVCNYFDGWFFRDITEYGYWVHEDKQSAIAFFPGQPLAAIFLTWLTGWPHLVTLPLVSNAAFVVALALISALVRTRWPDQSIGTRVTVLAVLAFYPAGLYFRIAYSESLFLAVTALLLLGFAKRWPLWVLALVAGASTGVRAVGVAGTAAVMVYVLFDRERGPLRRRLLTAAALAPVACWGLLAFMAFQWAQFGTPIAFVNAQEHWKHYVPPPNDTMPTWVKLVVGEPLWNTYIPGTSRHWWILDRHGIAGLGQGFWNPIAFLLTLVAVAFGWWRGWLNRTEATLGLLLVLIPYVTRGHAMCMASQSRFMSVVIPAFLVFGRALNRLPPAATGALVALMASLLTVWTMMFGATWPLF